MSLNRIQKLLFSEYSDFEDMVLVESPFAETTREGRGIRQVQIGLTPTKLVLATDIIKNASDYPIAFVSGCVDAEIECLELISIFPIELVTLSVFRRRRRKVLKAKFHDGNPAHNSKIVYFELGGSDKRKMFWNLWCERVRFLCPEERLGSSLTETSAASSTSNSSLHVVRTRVSNDKIWQYYGGGDSRAISPRGSRRWTDKDLFFGDKLELISYKIDPISFSSLIQNDTDEVQTLYRRKRFQCSRSSFSSVHSKDYSQKKAEPINRFGEGIHEGCNTSLYLPDVGHVKPSAPIKSPHKTPGRSGGLSPSAFRRECEEALRGWESRGPPKRSRHPRRYGLTTMSDLHYCFGVYFLGRGATFTMQMKKTPSVICLGDETVSEVEFGRAASRFHLCNSPSYESVRPWSDQHVLEQKPIYFWTTECWYKPTTVKRIYADLRSLTRERLRKGATCCESRNSSISNSSAFSKKSKLAHFGRRLLGSSKTSQRSRDDRVGEFEKSLRLENAVSIWDIDSTALALQLTMIDAQLFLKIPPGELKLLLVQKNGKSSIHLMTWLVFSYRVACLIATEIIRTEDVKCRARLVTRFINTAEKCHLLHNYQSCRTILSGLQCPGVYRLEQTWSQVRHFHASKYQIFEKLSRIHKDPRLPAYRKAFRKSCQQQQQQPYLPAAMHLLSTLLNRAVDVPANGSSSAASVWQAGNDEGFRGLADGARSADLHKSQMPKMLKQIFSALRMRTGAKPAKSCGSVASEELSDPERSSLDSQSVHLRLDPPSTDDVPNWSANAFLARKCDAPEVGDGLAEAEAILRAGQKAARKYNLNESGAARDFLLKMPYKDTRVNFFSSFRIEPD